MNNNAGPGWFFGTFVIGALIVVVVFGLSRLEDSQAQRYRAQAAATLAEGRARAMTIEAQGQARLDSAQAQSLMMIAALPYLAAIVGTIAMGMIFLSAIGVMVMIAKRKPEVHRIETRVMYLPAPGAPRREVWGRLSAQADKQPLLIDVKR